MQTDDDRPSAGTETPGEAAGGSARNQQHKLDDEMIEYGLTLKRRMSWVWWLLGFDRL